MFEVELDESHNEEDEELLVEESFSSIKDDSHTPNAKELWRAFRPVRAFLKLIGRFPYKIETQANGSCYFSHNPISVSNIIFCTLTGVTLIAFVLMAVGVFTMFLEYNFSEYQDKCEFTWESLTMYRCNVVVSVVSGWLILTFVNSYETLVNSERYVNYLNTWNAVVEEMQMDVSKKAKWVGFSGNVEFLITVLFTTIIMSLGFVPALQDGLAIMASATVRVILQSGIAICYRNEGFLPDVESWAIRQNKTHRCGEDVDTAPCSLNTALKVGRISAFVIMLYSLYGSRTTLCQFKFFCRLLRNAAVIWNQRFRNYKAPVLLGNEQMRIRLSMKSLLKDHLTLASLYTATDDVFNMSLRFFYAIQVLNVLIQLYFFTQLTYPATCDEHWEETLNFYQRCQLFIQYHDRLSKYRPNNSTTVTFDDPCTDTHMNLVQNGILAFLLLFQTLYLVIDTTLDGALAHEEGMRGFDVLRRYGFMQCANVNERNFIHSLIVSFARNVPLQISINHYFALTRSLILSIFASAFGLWIIIIQFRPGEITHLIDYSVRNNCTGRNSW